MNNPRSQKRIYDKIGRSFCLVFNRVTMYKIDHPHAAQAVTEFYNTVSEGLSISSQIVLIMNYEQFFVEEEPFDSRLNTSRMVAHFKKSAIESISFEDGINEAEIDNFFRVFCDQKQYPDADTMKAKIAELGVTHVKINFVFFKKMTSDEKVILKDKFNRVLEIEKKNPRKEVVKEVLNRIAEGVVLEEFEKSISLKNLMEDPAKISKQIIEADLSTYKNSAGVSAGKSNLGASAHRSSEEASADGIDAVVSADRSAGEASAGGNAGGASGGRLAGGASAGGSAGGVIAGGGAGGVSADGSAGGVIAGGGAGRASADGSAGGVIAGGSAGEASADGNAGGVIAGGSPGVASADGNAGGVIAGGSAGKASAEGNAGGVIAGGSPGVVSADGNAGGASAEGNAGGVIAGGSPGGVSDDRGAAGGSADSSAAGVSDHMSQAGVSYSPGAIIEDHLRRLKEELFRSEQGQAEIDLSELANAVFDMKANLLAGIEEKKALGVIYKNENQILNEANDISDRVIIQLVKEEYKKGSISVQRLGQILRRLIPDSKELQRLLPKLKEAMLAEGMSAAEFVNLVKEIGKELQSDELSEVLKKSAEKIGLDSEALIRELKLDPDGAAELIYLASEIRNGTGDEKVLTELLVDYIERVGSKFAFELPDDNSAEDGNMLREIILNLGSKLVNQLKMKDVNKDVLVAVEERLQQRIEKFLSKLEADLISKENTSPVEEEFGKTTVFRMLEESVDEGDELQKILSKVRQGIEDKSIDENNYQQIHDEILKIKAEQQEGKKKKHLPQGILNYVNTLLYLEKEICRSLRYDTPFSTITFSVFNLKPQKPVPAGSISGNDITNSIMGELINLLRGADLVGILNKTMILVFLPMTNENNAKTALQRIIRRLHAAPFIINDIPIVVQFAGAVTSCSHELTPDLHTYLSAAENNHNDLVNRLRNVQELM